jgi:hypothetical protein
MRKIQHGMTEHGYNPLRTLTAIHGNEDIDVLKRKATFCDDPGHSHLPILAKKSQPQLKFELSSVSSE